MQTYGIVILAAAYCALLVMLLQGNKAGIQLKTAGVFGALAVPLCVLAGRGAYWLCSIEWMKKINVSFWDFAGSGYSYMLYGAVLGGFLAVLLTSLLTGDSFGAVADAAAAPAALVIAAGRFGEYLVNAGLGSGIVEWFDPYEEWSMIAWEEPDAICRFPFAVQKQPYGTWCFAINFLEGLAALIFLIVLLRLRRRKAGGSATLLLLMYAACQIVFESMRRDDVIIWGFVKASQLISAVLILGILLFCWLKQPAERRKVWELCLRMVILLLFAGIIMLMEFALDQKIVFLMWMRADLSYIVMAFCCLGKLLTVLPVWKRAFPKEQT